MSIRSTATLAYMAGLVDGEGTIGVFPYNSSHKKYPEGYPRYRPILAVVNTNRAMLEWIVEHFGGRVRPVKRYRVDWKLCYTWQVSHSQALEVLRDIKPFLIAKREQAELFIEFQSGAKRYGRALIPPDIAYRRVEIADRIKDLNRNGDRNAVEGKRCNEVH